MNKCHLIIDEHKNACDKIVYIIYTKNVYIYMYMENPMLYLRVFRRE